MNNTKYLGLTVALVGAMFASQATATTYYASISGDLKTANSGSFASTAAFARTSGQGINLKIDFYFDDSTLARITTIPCGGADYILSQCESVGFSVFGLAVSIDGVVDRNWVLGPADSTLFSVTKADMRGRDVIFQHQIPGAPSSNAGVTEAPNAWFGLHNLLDPTASITFGGMYRTAVGYGYVAQATVAVNELGQRAVGFDGMYLREVSPVPEPAVPVMFLAGGAMIALLRRPKPRLALVVGDRMRRTCSTA